MLDWLNTARTEAEERFRSLPFPGAKDEFFRFSTLGYQAGVSAQSIACPEEASKLSPEEQALLVIRGEEGVLSGDTPGFLFSDVLGAAKLGSEAVRAHLKENVLFREDKFAQLTGARWRNGAFLHVPAGAKFTKPVRFVTAPAGSEEHFRHLILLDDGAEAVVIQESWSDAEERFCGELTELRLGRGAKLHWIVLQAMGGATSATVRQRIDLAEGAELRYTPLFVGARAVQARQECHLGKGASFDTEGAARGDGGQQFDFWLDLRHEGARSISNMAYWFVLAGKARGVFNGQIDVARGALDCESGQRSKTLLLGSGSVNAVPRLIIKTDAVKASHGASVSSVSAEQLHYLQSRGIPRAEAESMIVHGFTERVVARFPTTSLQEKAERLLGAKQGGSA